MARTRLAIIGTESRALVEYDSYGVGGLGGTIGGGVVGGGAGGAGGLGGGGGGTGAGGGGGAANGLGAGGAFFAKLFLGAAFFKPVFFGAALPFFATFFTAFLTAFFLGAASSNGVARPNKVSRIALIVSSLRDLDNVSVR